MLKRSRRKGARTGKLNRSGVIRLSFFALSAIVMLSAAHLAAAGSGSTDDARRTSTPSRIQKGRKAFGINCAFCHGASGTGGEGGPNLLQSALVRADKNGEAIAVVVQYGRPAKGMPKFSLSKNTISDMAAYLRSLRAGGDADSFDPNRILVGDAGEGKAYFYGKGRCSECHSLNGDLAHIGAKYDPKTLQDDIVTGASVGPFGAKLSTAPAETATVTLGSGETVKGTVLEIDDFAVTLLDQEGNRRSFRREGAEPRVEVVDPLRFHRDMLRAWDDRDIHNLTAFLVNQK